MSIGNDPLVSIVMPVYNSEAFVAEALESVLAQTYRNWELVVVDDCSNDGSAAIIEEFAARHGENRIRFFRHESNKGAAATRRTAFGKVNGDVLAFLDSDDVWMPEKLERQLEFMRRADVAMCFTAYETVEADGSHRNFVHVPESLDYHGFLKNTVTCTHTVAFDLRKVPFGLFLVQHPTGYDYPEDLDTWLRILKSGIVGHGFNEVLAKYRKHRCSRSSYKVKAVSRTWNQYRRNEGLSVPYSAYCLFWQLFHAVLKRI